MAMVMEECVHVVVLLWLHIQKLESRVSWIYLVQEEEEFVLYRHDRTKLQMRMV